MLTYSTYVVTGSHGSCPVCENYVNTTGHKGSQGFVVPGLAVAITMRAA